MRFYQVFTNGLEDIGMAVWACIQDGMSDEEILRCLEISEKELKAAKGDVEYLLAVCMGKSSPHSLAELTDIWIELKKCMLMAASNCEYSVEAVDDSVIITCPMEHNFTITATVSTEWMDAMPASGADDLHDAFDDHLKWLEKAHLSAEMAKAYTPNSEQQQEIEYLDAVKNAVEQFHLTVPDAHILTMMLNDLDAKTIAEKMDLSFEIVRKIRRDIMYQVQRVVTEKLKLQDEINTRIHARVGKYSDSLWAYYETLKKAEITLLHPVKIVKNDDVEAIYSYRMHITGNGFLDALLTDELYMYEKELEALAAAGGCYRAIDLQYYHLIKLIREAERRMYIYSTWISLHRYAGDLLKWKKDKDTLDVTLKETGYEGIFQKRMDLNYIIEYVPERLSHMDPDAAVGQYTADEREAVFYINDVVLILPKYDMIGYDALHRYEKDFVIY